MIRNKAGSENQKVGEVAFLTNLTYDYGRCIVVLSYNRRYETV